MSEIYGSDRDLPPVSDIPAWLQPVPTVIENLGLRFVWLVVGINLAGTAFGFYYYLPQFSITPAVMWPFIPDSPLATLFIAAALGSWALGWKNEYLLALAFFGNVILGFWTPWTLAIFSDAFMEINSLPMYTFLFVSHLLMVVQALVLHRVADFPLRAIIVAAVWYTVDLTVDFFIPIVGESHDWLPIRPHHTIIPLEYSTEIAAGANAFQLAAWGAVVLTMLSLFWTTAIRIKKLDD